MSFFSKASLLTFSLLTSYHQKVQAQEGGFKLTNTEIAITIDSINRKLDAFYVFPKVAAEMAAYLNERLKASNYESLSNPHAFAEQLTADLQSVSHDKHLRVLFNPDQIEEQQNDSEQERIQQRKRLFEEMEQQKFGFETVKMLEGRVGYLDLRAFMETEFAAEAAHRAMRRLTNTDAMIIDLRENSGGSPSMIQLLSSYFFDREPVHLNSFYWRPSEEITETWTLLNVPGKRRPDIDLYILTSNRTFSAAEEFAYNMQNLSRATLVGETTAGGAHPGGIVAATDKFSVWVPQGRAINPITKTNWEGTGVVPDIKVAEEEALLVAHVKALEKFKATSTDPSLIHSLEYSIRELKSSLKLEQSKYADLLVDARYVKWNDKHDTFYGTNFLFALDTVLKTIDPKKVLGNNYYYVTLPRDSYLIVRFTDNFVVDVPGQADLFIEEIGRTGDRAAIYISTDGITYEKLGIASGGITNALDLADINFKGIVNYVKIIGLDLNGSSPGFDVARVYGLPIANIDRYVSEDEMIDYLEDPNSLQRRIHLSPIEFDFDSYDLNPEGIVYLDDLIKVLLAYPELKLKIVGHTDNIGTEEFNEALSKKRAKSVYNYFVDKGLRPSNLTYEGRGTREPLAHNDSEKGRRKNRRVEVIKLDK